MKITEFYIYAMYLVVIITSMLFIVKDYYIIGSLLILGNLVPGYAMANSLMGNNEN
jgi:hypothetical protein